MAGRDSEDLPVAVNRWRLIEDRPLTAARNMAIDEALFRSVSEGRSLPVLRIYRWEPPGVSIGYSQSLQEAVNLDAVRAAGYGLVRRPTGGRGIIHNHEITYSVAIRCERLRHGQSVVRSYRELSRGIEAGLQILGIQPKMPRKRRSTENAGREEKQLDGVCFSKALRADMVADGRKIVGSAQMRSNGTVLQHGSIPLTLDEDEHIRILCPEGVQSEGNPRRLREAAVGVADMLEGAISARQLAKAIVEGFRKTFDIDFADQELTARERHLADELTADKYGAENWTEHREIPANLKPVRD